MACMSDNCSGELYFGLENGVCGIKLDCVFSPHSVGVLYGSVIFNFELLSLLAQMIWPNYVSSLQPSCPSPGTDCWFCCPVLSHKTRVALETRPDNRRGQSWATQTNVRKPRGGPVTEKPGTNGYPWMRGMYTARRDRELMGGDQDSARWVGAWGATLTRIWSSWT